MPLFTINIDNNESAVATLINFIYKKNSQLEGNYQVQFLDLFVYTIVSMLLVKTIV